MGADIEAVAGDAKQKTALRDQAKCRALKVQVCGCELVAIAAVVVTAASAATTAAVATASAAITTVAAAATAASATTTTAAITATTTAAATTTTAESTRTFFTRAGFVHREVASLPVHSVEGLDGCCHGLWGAHRHESKSAWASCFTIHREMDVRYFTMLGEKLAHFHIGGFEGEIPHIHLRIHCLSVWSVVGLAPFGFSCWPARV